MNASVRWLRVLLPRLAAEQTVIADRLGRGGFPVTEIRSVDSDTIMTVDVPGNRPDAGCHIGLAREIGALFDVPFTPPDPAAPARVAARGIHQSLSASIEDAERCAAFAAALVVDVAVGPSPDWVQRRLESLGVGSATNVADVLALIGLEFGVALRAFDFDAIAGGAMVVRRARSGETLEVPEHGALALDGDDTVLADELGPLALADLVQGGRARVEAASHRVLLARAAFDRHAVTRAAKRHRLAEPVGIADAASIPDALAHAAALLTELARGSGAPGMIWIGGASDAPPSIAVRAETLQANGLALDDAIAVAECLGCTVHHDDASAEMVRIEPPSFRSDLADEARVVADIRRVLSARTEA